MVILGEWTSILSSQNRNTDVQFLISDYVSFTFFCYLLYPNLIVFTRRGENGELRVGIRRLSRPCISKPSSCFPSESVGGVLATVSHAIMTRTMFTVY